MGRQGAAGDVTPGARQRSLRVVLVSGIYPPDIGGPATHIVDLAEELAERGHRPVVLTLTDQPGPQRQPGLTRFPREWRWPVRGAAVVAWLVRRRRDYDVVYATGLQSEAVLGARLARRPVIVKIVGDPAWERGRRLGLTSQGFDEFQRSPADALGLRAMRRLRDWSVRTPTRVVAPSEFLARCVAEWRGKAGVTVIPNGVRTRGRTPPDAARTGPMERLVVVSRLAEHKRIDVVIEAVARTGGVRLEIVGDGPDRQRLEALVDKIGVTSRVAFVGSVSHDEVMTRLAEADALVTASSYEGLPHVVIEALSAGTPVISSAAGGVPEVLGGGTGGVIVDPPTPGEFARVLREIRDDPDRLQALREGAGALGTQWQFSTCADSVESLLLDCSSRGRRPRRLRRPLRAALRRGEVSRSAR